MVVSAMIGAAMLLPLTAIFLFRIYENQLVRNTEVELIAQSAAVSAVMSSWLDVHGGAALPLGAAAPPPDRQAGEAWNPVLPRLDLHRTPILPPRSMPEPSANPIAAPYRAVGEHLDPVIARTQQATLAGFRILDVNGTVIAGGEDVGVSYAHLSEIQTALAGHYASVLREREVKRPQPIYSISRGTKVRVFAALPVVVEGRIAGVVYAWRTPSNVVKEFYYLRKRLAVAALAIGVLALVMVLIFSRAIANPIRQLRERAIRMGRGDREAIGPLRHHGSREVYDLSNTLMEMSRKLFDRTDYINSFAAHVSHELKSPLTSIRGAIELLKDGDMTDAQRAQFLDNIAADAERGTRLLERLRALAKADNMDVEGECRLSDVLTACRNDYPSLSFDVRGDAIVPMSAENTAIVFHNLFDNARKHGARSVAIATTQDGERVTIDVRDDGSGISDGNAPRVFELFFTTRRQAGGTGLGLGIVRSLLRAHGGSINLVGGDGGAHFRICGFRRR